MVRVLLPLAHGFEEIEAVTTIDILRRAQMDVVVAGIGAERLTTGSHQISVVADMTLAQVLVEATPAEVADQFDALVLPGGPGTRSLQTDARVQTLIQVFEQKGRWVAAICAAPMALAKAGILKDRAATSFFSPEAYQQAIQGGPPFNLETGPIADYRLQPVVVDQKVITSRGAGTAVEFALQVVAELVNRGEAERIAQSIHSSWTPVKLSAAV
ncbi:MAG: DJ-1/PfpI family protein [Synechococcaceae cyanobacterium SM2_3_1]|nr:DJ-1/PfpI family protein [Synechococcaceae cyanobacterium SM2_3_1]